LGGRVAESIVQLEKEALEFRQEMARFLDGLISHYVFDEGKLVVAHAGPFQRLEDARAV
jgi:protein phosphatase